VGGLFVLNAAAARSAVVLRGVIQVQFRIHPWEAPLLVEDAGQEGIGIDLIRRRLLTPDRTHHERPDLPLVGGSQYPVSAQEGTGNVGEVDPRDQAAAPKIQSEFSHPQLGSDVGPEETVRPDAEIELQHIVTVFHLTVDRETEVIEGAGVEKLGNQQERFVPYAELSQRLFRKLRSTGGLVFSEGLAIGLITPTRLETEMEPVRHIQRSVQMEP